MTQFQTTPIIQYKPTRGKTYLLCLIEKYTDPFLPTSNIIVISIFVTGFDKKTIETRWDE